MKVKELIKELLNAKMDDEVKLYDASLDKLHEIGLVNIIPSARNKGELHIEFMKRDD